MSATTEAVARIPALYVVAESPTGPCKIGYASSGNRFGELQVGNPRLLSVPFTLPCQHAPHMERVVHGRLRAKRLRGEWFDISVDEATATIEAVIAEGCGPERQADPDVDPVATFLMSPAGRTIPPEVRKVITDHLAERAERRKYMREYQRGRRKAKKRKAKR